MLGNSRYVKKKVQRNLEYNEIYKYNTNNAINDIKNYFPPLKIVFIHTH